MASVEYNKTRALNMFKKFNWKCFFYFERNFFSCFFFQAKIRHIGNVTEKKQNLIWGYQIKFVADKICNWHNLGEISLCNRKRRKKKAIWRINIIVRNESDSHMPCVAFLSPQICQGNQDDCPCGTTMRISTCRTPWTDVSSFFLFSSSLLLPLYSF